MDWVKVFLLIRSLFEGLYKLLELILSRLDHFWLSLPIRKIDHGTVMKGMSPAIKSFSKVDLILGNCQVMEPPGFLKIFDGCLEMVLAVMKFLAIVIFFTNSQVIENFKLSPGQAANALSGLAPSALALDRACCTCEFNASLVCFPKKTQGVDPAMPRLVSMLASIMALRVS